MKQNSYVSRLVWFYRNHGRGVVIWGSFATVFPHYPRSIYCLLIISAPAMLPGLVLLRFLLCHISSRQTLSGIDQLYYTSS